VSSTAIASKHFLSLLCDLDHGQMGSQVTE
jgi:hypothetical protein